MSKNTNELKTRAPGRFGGARLGSDAGLGASARQKVDPALTSMRLGARITPHGPGRILDPSGGLLDAARMARSAPTRLVKILERPAVQQFAPFQRLLESAIAVGYVFQFSGRSCDGLEDHAELHLRVCG